MKMRWLILPLVILLALLWGTACAQDEAEWTILWYLCGTDLESDDGSATFNLEQAMAGKTSDGANVLIVTGGTNEWQNDIVSNSEIGVYQLTSNGKDGGMTKISHQKDENMADVGLLSSMIQQIFAQYPAKHKMLLLWDHGGGSVGGVAFDERTDDSFSLAELDTALAQGGQHFDIIGFDACLMATLEVANTLTPYADYMVASQELEPGGGWNYQGIHGGDLRQRSHCARGAWQEHLRQLFKELHRVGRQGNRHDVADQPPKDSRAGGGF